jgi:hypothetical protein
MNCLLRRAGLAVACAGIILFSDRQGAGAAAPQTLRPDLTVFSVTDTIAPLGRTPAALRRECQ